MLRAALIFIAVYVGLVVTRRFRPHVAWLGIIVALVLGVLKPAEIFFGINWNVIGIFVGSLILAELFIFSRVPETISDLLINKSPSLGVAFLLIIIFTSILSAFIENVATVLILAPVALELARKAGVSPVPVIVGLAVSSNLQGTATLIGDPPSMIMAANMKMNFLDFFLYQGKLGIFFFVEAGAVAGFLVLYLYLRGIKQRPEPLPVTPVTSWAPVYFISIMILLLSLAGFFDPDFVWFGGTVCIVMGLVGCVWLWLRERREARKLLRSIDWQTTAFLAAVFVLVTMLERRGTIDALVGRIGFLAGANRFTVYTIVVWFSVLVSAFIDNVPYITAFLPVVIGLSERLGYPSEVLVFGVLIGSCLGGNITPIGASANIVAVGILQREGRPVSFGSFVKIGLPFTLAATAVSYILLWLLYR
ncbi:MAG: TRAP transporter large permease subunit [bacterium]|nr:MAG: TRAP transporter large permease subunit [bacterium]